VPRGHRLLFVHPETRPDKVWPIEGYRNVLRAFLDTHRDITVIAASGWDFGLDRVVSLDLHYELALAVLARSDLFLGIDSCFLHAADMFRLPSVGLFGPTSPAHWGFRLTPAGRHVWGEGSMDRIRERDVEEALRSIA